MNAGRLAFFSNGVRGALLALGASLYLLVPHSAISQTVDSPVDIIDRSGQTPTSDTDQVESKDLSANAQTQIPDANRAETNNLSALFYEQQLLQNEVKKLRGELEELGHKLNELARQQSAQYLDMDKRLQKLGAAADPRAAAEVDGESAQTTSDPSGTGQQPSEPLSEEDAYQQAFALIDRRQFEEAVSAYDQFLIRYPNGEFTVNAFYWLGELHLRLEDFEKSRQSFVQVLTLFPEHQKVPDALFKLGIVYDRLGDRETSDRYLQQATRDHPGTTAARLATEYLRERN